MKLGLIEVSGIKRIVEGKAHWERYRDRWVKYVNDKAVKGLSDHEMYEYLKKKIEEFVTYSDGKTWHLKYRIWVHNETINVETVPKPKK